MPLEVSLEGQVAALSGGSRGIGAATVRMLAEAGARVLFSFAGNRAAAAETIAAAGGDQRCAAIACDAGAPGSGEKLVEATVARFGRLDIAIANAGIWNSEDLAIEDLNETLWQETIDCNLRGVYSLARAATTQFKRQPANGSEVRGRFIAIASTAGQRGEAWHTHYGAAKAGVIGFVRGLAPELARAGIRVNCVAPGWVATDMAAAAIAAHPERVAGAIPLGRPGRAEEIAGCVMFLCLPWSNFLTGSVISANGGAVLA